MIGVMAASSPSIVPVPTSSLRSFPTGDSGPTFRGVPVEELKADFATAWVSRLLDDREIALQKQSRVFFQISGAGHEALLIGLGRELRPGYDWFFPYYRDRALMLALGVTPEEILLEAVGSAADPASGGRQMSCHWGNAALNIVTQSSPTGSQCLPAVGLCRGQPVHLPPAPTRLRRLRGRADLRVARRRGHLRRRVLGKPQHRLQPPPAGALRGCRQRLRHFGPFHRPVAGAHLGAGTRLPRPACTPLDGRDYFEVRARAADIVAEVRAGVGPALIHATVTRPYSHSSQDTQSKYRSPRNSPTRPPTIRWCSWSGPWSRAAC